MVAPYAALGWENRGQTGIVPHAALTFTTRQQSKTVRATSAWPPICERGSRSTSHRSSATLVTLAVRIQPGSEFLENFGNPTLEAGHYVFP